jgi:hypothetical protein
VLVGIVAVSVAPADDGRLVEPPVAGDAIRLEAANLVIFPQAVPPAVRLAPNRAQLVPAVEGQAFQRRVIVLRNVRGGIFVSPGPRGRDAWISSILRTTQPETARANAQQRLDDWLAVLTRAFQLTAEQQAKLRLAGEGDISRFLEDCEAVVGEALAVEAQMSADEGDLSTVPYWERCNDLRDRYAGGLHGEGSLFRKQWERVCVEAGLEPRPWERGAPQPSANEFEDRIELRVLVR